MNTTPDIIARTLIGSPYRHQGRNPVTGLDCVGVLVVVAQRLGLPVIDRTNYPVSPDGSLLDQLRRNLIEADLTQPYNVDDLNVGDVLVFWATRQRSVPSHVGIRTDHGFVHAISTAKHVQEVSLTRNWVSRITNVFKWPTQTIDPSP